MKSRHFYLSLAMACLAATPVFTAPVSGVPPTQPVATQPTSTLATASRPAAQPKLTVAILDFKCDTPATPDLGEQIALTLVGTMSGQPGYSIVDRTDIIRTLKEQELSLTGLIDTGSVLKVGKLVGAKLLISGQVFSLGKDTMVTAKIVGVETSLVEGVIVKDDNNADVGVLVMQLSEKLIRKINESGPAMVAQNAEVFDPLPALKQKLSTRRLPKMAVAVSEQQLPAVSSVKDPAVETELRKLLIQAGLTVIDVPETEWLRGGVEVGIKGDAISERAGQIGKLISCTDRVEIRVTNLHDGSLRLADSDHNRAVDLSETLAAKTALQKSGRILAIKILEQLVETLPVK